MLIFLWELPEQLLFYYSPSLEGTDLQIDAAVAGVGSGENPSDVSAAAATEVAVGAAAAASVIAAAVGIAASVIAATVGIAAATAVIAVASVVAATSGVDAAYGVAAAAATVGRTAGGAAGAVIGEGIAVVLFIVCAVQCLLSAVAGNHSFAGGDAEQGLANDFYGDGGVDDHGAAENQIGRNGGTFVVASGILNGQSRV